MTADDALYGLRLRGRSYRPDIRRADGAWIADCPRCGEPDRLELRESLRGGGVSGGCRLCGPIVLIDLATAVEEAANPPSVPERVRRLELVVTGLRLQLDLANAALDRLEASRRPAG